MRLVGRLWSSTCAAAQGLSGWRSCSRLPEPELVASDVDPAAVACARRNVEPAGGTVVEGDLDSALPDRLRGRVDVITCNAPYVPTGAIATMPPEARDHEHRVALDGGADGLAVVRRVMAVAPEWLAPGRRRRRRGGGRSGRRGACRGG